MILKNLKTVEGKTISIEINGDKIAKIYDGITQTGENMEGRLVTPALVDSHAHLDSNFLLDVCKEVETPKFVEALNALLECKSKLSAENIYNLAKKSIYYYISHGTLFLRTHVMIDDTLDRLKYITKLKKEFKDLIDIQIIGFIQSYSYFDDNARENMYKALELADGIGGQPHLQPSREDGINMIKSIFDAVEGKDLLLDFHADFADDPETKFSEVIISETLKRKMQGKVSLSHVTAMHSYNEDYFRRYVRWLRESKINVIVAPITALEESGAFENYPKRRGIARVLDLISEGVNVALGHDDIQNHLNPYGVGDMLQAGFTLAISSYMYFSAYAKTIFDLMTYNGAKAQLLNNYGLEEGKDANLVIYNSTSSLDALREIKPRRMVIRKGNIIYESEINEKWNVN
ncbi:amidohydrolase family protein [Acidianus sulfidivorans JP7]|uniref:Amidohydrolase-related domain-containing protein n=1 Tax=Acidianus sulfidivorans JP7 TaxID=619593 RepID=A0A2U9ILG2_9CREN|nr:amidohydrolase family protein [Acidianus sulfidivorans]AWR96840.1 amidohydrolase family protein [Acidianus sulfidivorans JP7]